MAQGLGQRHPALREPGRLLPLQLGRERLSLLGREPPGLPRPVGEGEEHDHTHHDRRDAPGDVDPLPAREAEQLRVVDEHASHDLVGADAQEEVRDLGAHDLRDGGRHEEEGEGARPVAAREPVGEVDDHPGIEAGLRQAQQEPHEVEVERRPDGGGERGHDAPGDHDAGDPEAGAPLLDDERARDLEEEVAQEEDAGAEADDRVVEAGQLPGHGELGDGHVRAIDERDDVGDEADREETQVGLPPGAVEGAHRDDGPRSGRGRHAALRITTPRLRPASEVSFGIPRPEEVLATMSSDPVTPEDLRGVFAVPPLPRRTDTRRTLDLDEAERVAAHVARGGITRLLYGGNAFLYHVTLAEYESAPRLAGRLPEGALGDPQPGPVVRPRDRPGAAPAAALLPGRDGAAVRRSARRGGTGGRPARDRGRGRAAPHPLPQVRGRLRADRERGLDAIGRLVERRRVRRRQVRGRAARPRPGPVPRRRCSGAWTAGGS